MKWILLIVSVTIMSCSVNNKFSKIRGTYQVVTKDTAFMNAYLKLKNNGNFTLEWEMYYAQDITTGTFEISSDTMIFNSLTPDFNAMGRDTNKLRLNDSTFISASDLNYFRLGREN